MMRYPQHIRTFIIQAWIEGYSRSEIASKLGVSTGTVSNVVDEWKNMIGSYDANSIRILGIGMKKAAI